MAHSTLFSLIESVIALLITHWIRAEYIYKELSCRRYPKSMHDERMMLSNSSSSSSYAGSSCLNDVYNQCKHISYPSHSFVEVSRSSLPFIAWKDNQVGYASRSWYEGYSEGHYSCSPMEADHEFASCYEGIAMDTVPYGCWFFHAEGSGIYIDVGKTLIGTEASILEHFSLDSMSECLKSYVPQDYTSDIINVNCVDKYYCSRALSLGYDSVQIIDRQEVIICSGMCATHRFDGACPPVTLYRRAHITHEESSIDSSKIHGVKPSGHAAEAHGDGNGSSYRYEDCRCDDSGDVMNCDNDIYTFHHIHHDTSSENSSASPSVDESILPVEPSKTFNLTLFFGSRLLDNRQHLVEFSQMCRSLNDLNHITNNHPVLMIDIESSGTVSNAYAYGRVLDKVIPTPRQLAVLKEMDDLQLFRLLGSGGYYPRREKSGNAHHLYDASSGNCLLYTNLVGMKSSIVVEINQVRVGIIDLTSQKTAYLHEDEDSRILLVEAIRHQAAMLRDEERVHVVVLIVFADFDTSSHIARHTKEQVSLILGIHDGDEVANCYGKFYDVDSDRVIQVPFSSIDYSRENLDTRMAIGSVDIVGRLRSSIGTSNDDWYRVEFTIRSDMIMNIGRYRVQSIQIDPSGVTYGLL